MLSSRLLGGGFGGTLGARRAVRSQPVRWCCGRVADRIRRQPGTKRGPDHLILTVAPASSSSFLSFSASSLEMPVLIVLGSRLDQVLGLLEAQAGGRADDLDDVDLVGADGLEDDVELGLGRRRPRRRPAAGGGAGDRHGGGGRLDPVDDLEVFAQRLGFEDGQLDDRVAQGLDVVGERGGFGGGHRVVRSFLALSIRS